MLARRKRGCCRWCWKTRRRCCGRRRQCLRWCWQWRRICCGRCRQGGGGKKGKTKRWAAGVEAEDDQAEGDLHGGHQVGILLWKLFCWSIFFLPQICSSTIGKQEVASKSGWDRSGQLLKVATMSVGRTQVVYTASIIAVWIFFFMFETRPRLLIIAGNLDSSVWKPPSSGQRLPRPPLSSTSRPLR